MKKTAVLRVGKSVLPGLVRRKIDPSKLTSSAALISLLHSPSAGNYDTRLAFQVMRDALGGIVNPNKKISLGVAARKLKNAGRALETQGLQKDQIREMRRALAVLLRSNNKGGG